MKLSPSLIGAIALGVAVSTAAASCRRDDVKSGSSGKEKENGQKKNPDKSPGYCPTCGMG